MTPEERLARLEALVTQGAELHAQRHLAEPDKALPSACRICSELRVLGFATETDDACERAHLRLAHR